MGISTESRIKMAEVGLKSRDAFDKPLKIDGSPGDIGIRPIWLELCDISVSHSAKITFSRVVSTRLKRAMISHVSRMTT
jgi:hypothetical protein